jgi:diadenosine tetraphosphatase ApaH/serine/threonine PP2A family protein phosphatase
VPFHNRAPSARVGTVISRSLIYFIAYGEAMKAILSDIHGNLEALQAVLQDIAAHGVKEIYCLGDTVGYGPNPLECLDLTMSWEVVLMGNFELATCTNPENFGVNAGQSVTWTGNLLMSAAENPSKQQHRIEYLLGRPHSYQEGSFLFVHGSPHNPVHEYVFPEDLYNPKKMCRIAERLHRYCFSGHTHVPGIFVARSPKVWKFFRTAPQSWEFFTPSELRGTYRLDGRKTICNVGSVGQPRDGDWRACYVLLDGDEIHFRRLEYDVQTTFCKIYAIPDLAYFSGDRLLAGH